MRTIDMGIVNRCSNGQFTTTYTLSYTTTRKGVAADGTPTVETVRVKRTLPADGIERVGRLVSRRADQGKAWDIAVTTSTGEEVTFEFDCFRN